MFRTSYSTMKFSHFVFNFNLSSRKVNSKDEEKKDKTKEDKTINNFETINNEVVLSIFSFFLISYLFFGSFFSFLVSFFLLSQQKIITTFCDGHQKLFDDNRKRAALPLKKLMQLPQAWPHIYFNH